MDKLFSIIRDLIAKKFWGKVEISFENGNIVIVRKTENIKV